MEYFPTTRCGIWNEILIGFQVMEGSYGFCSILWYFKIRTYSIVINMQHSTQ